ncbi:MAG TPA: DUF4390 domain-containing protein [Vicinamibacterales bacterium]|nr:DUF4390 domain-containing protein [Vicinamibacterales bacterium]
MTRVRSGLILALVMASAAVVFASGNITINAIPTEGRVKLSFNARDCWNLATRQFLSAGTLVIFDYDVELRRPGSAPWLGLFDSVLARTAVSTTAKFDTLVRKYSVSRMRSGSVFASDTFKQEAEVKDWLTTFASIELEPTAPLEPNAEYYVYVVLTIRPKKSTPSLFSILPFGREECYGRQSFTYIAR